MGDYNGISMEILLNAFQNEQLFQYCTPVLFGHPEIFRFYANQLGLSHLRYHLVKNPGEAVANKINLMTVDATSLEITPGTPTTESGQFAIDSLKAAVDSIKKGEVHNLLTLPIDKSNTHGPDFQFAGHTDYLAEEFGADDYMMMLVSDEMRVGLATGHIPVKDVALKLNHDLIRKKLDILLESLRLDFGIVKPKIAVLGLNPHSGDNGLIGMEEKEILKPVIDEFLEKGEMVFGPYPADGFFGKKGYQQFDAVLAMYHDQGLIPFKQLSFSDGVNYTAGLPIVRTSPDHGTAFNIAGKNEADPTSMINAIFLLRKIYVQRIEFMELNKSPLPFIKHRREKFSIGVPNLK